MTRVRRLCALLVFAGFIATGCGALPWGSGDATASRTATPSMSAASSPTGVACASSANPVPRKDMAFVYMTSRKEAVLFGGSDALNNVLADTWTFKGGCWSNTTASQSPAARDFTASAYDPALGIVLLYGGRGGGQFYFDTWAWNGLTWAELASTGPSMFGGPVAGFDPVKQRPILFGMVSGGSSETWAWDGSQWQRQSPVHSPAGRQTPSMALDAVRGQLLLFGGVSPGVGALNDTWTWNGTDWVQLTPATSPSPRFRATMGSSSAQMVIVLWGGVGAGVLLGDAWKWDGTNWSQIGSPGTRSDAAATDAGNRVLFFGGQSSNSHYNDLREFDGTSWVIGS